MQAQSSQDLQSCQGRQVRRPMRMFRLPSNLETLDPFWDLPQRLLKDWGRTRLFFAHLSLHPHPKHAIFCLTRPYTPWTPGPRVHHRTSHLQSSTSRGSAEVVSLPEHGAPTPYCSFDPLTSPLNWLYLSCYRSTGRVWSRRAPSAHNAHSRIHPSLPDAAAAFRSYTPLRCMLVAADLEAFEELCSFLKALALDDEDLRLSLKRNGRCALLSLGSPKLIFRRTLSMSARGAVQSALRTSPSLYLGKCIYS